MYWFFRLPWHWLGRPDPTVGVYSLSVVQP
jgi:hypothetical protein